MKKSISILLTLAVFLLTIPVYTISYEYTYNNAYHNYQSYNNNTQNSSIISLYNNISKAIKAGVIICSLALICKVIKFMNTPLTAYGEPYFIPRVLNTFADHTLGETYLDKIRTTSSIIFFAFITRHLTSPFSKFVTFAHKKVS